MVGSGGFFFKSLYSKFTKRSQGPYLERNSCKGRLFSFTKFRPSIGAFSFVILSSTSLNSKHGLIELEILLRHRSQSQTSL